MSIEACCWQAVRRLSAAGKYLNPAANGKGALRICIRYQWDRGIVRYVGSNKCDRNKLFWRNEEECVASEVASGLIVSIGLRYLQETEL